MNGITRPSHLTGKLNSPPGGSPSPGSQGIQISIAAASLPASPPSCPASEVLSSAGYHHSSSDFIFTKKKIIISKHISPPGGEPNLTTKLFSQVLLVQEKGSFDRIDRDNSICRSPDSTPAYMTSWYFISITDSNYHNSHIKNNYFFITTHPSPIDFRPPQPTPSPSAPDQSPSPQ